MEIVNIFYEELPPEYEEFHFGEEIEIEPEEWDDATIIIYAPFYRVEDKDLIYAEGIFCNYDEETNTLEPDWDLVLIYENVEDNKFDPTKYLYFEQGTEMSAIHNFCQYRGY